MNYSSAVVSDVPMMFEYPGHSNKTKEEAAEEQEEMLYDDDDVNMLTTKFTTINSTTRTTNEDDDEEEEQRQFADERNFAWALEETNNNKATRTTTTTTTASLKRAVLPQQQQQQQSVMMNSNNNNETNNYKNYKSEADAIKSILKTRTTRTTNDEEMKDDDDSEKINSASTPSINVLEQARRTMRDRRQTLRVVELFMTLEKFDTESQLVDMVEKSLTRSEFKDACEERGLTGKCGWPLCSNDCVYVKINHNNNTNDNNNSNKNNNGGVGYKSKAIMKLLSDDEKTYCSAAHRKQSELFCEKFLREKVDDKKSLPPRSDRHTNFSESTMNSLDVIERNFDKKMTMTENNNDNNNTSNQSVKAVANNDENNNNNNNNNNIKKNEKSVKWNKELDDSSKTKDDNNNNNNNNNLAQEKKEEKKEEVGIFYFDIHEEGMRTNNRKSSKFIPSIGGRFAEGQLSSVPLRPDSPMNINLDTSLEEEGRDDGDDHDVDLNAEDAKMIFDDGNNINDINDNSVLHRELIKKALLANPVYKKYSPHGENDEAAETEESEKEESEEEEEEDEESFFILKKKEEDLSLFGQTWMVLDAWVSKSTHLHFGSKFLNDDDDEEVCAQKLPFRDSRSAQFAQSTSNEFAASMNRILRSSNQLNKKLQCEKYLALLMRTFDFQSTSHVPKWPESRWDLICAICLDLDSKRSGFCFDDYYKLYIITNDDEVDDNNSLSNILKEEEEIRLIKDLFLYARYRD